MPRESIAASAESVPSVRGPRRRVKVGGGGEHDLIDRDPVLARLDAKRLRAGGEIDDRAQHAAAPAVVLPAPVRQPGCERSGPQLDLIGNPPEIFLRLSELGFPPEGRQPRPNQPRNANSPTRRHSGGGGVKASRRSACCSQGSPSSDCSRSSCSLLESPSDASCSSTRGQALRLSTRFRCPSVSVRRTLRRWQNPLARRPSAPFASASTWSSRAGLSTWRCTAARAAARLSRCR